MRQVAFYQGSGMSRTPIVFKSTHRIQFSELDPYNHVSTGNYATYYVDHRMQGLRDHVGWDLTTHSSSAPWSIPPERTCRAAS